MDGEKAPGGTVARLPSVHEQEDGTILAVCATGSSSRDSLLSWVRRLEVGLQSSLMALWRTQFVPLDPLPEIPYSCWVHTMSIVHGLKLEEEKPLFSRNEKTYPPSVLPCLFLIMLCFHQVSNPRLEDMVVLFTLTSPLGPVIPVQETSSMSRH